MALTSGSKDIAAKGTAEPLSTASLGAGWVLIQAKTDNTGVVYIGDKDVDVDNGITLAKGERETFVIDDLSSVYVDAATNGDGVTFLYS